MYPVEEIIPLIKPKLGESFQGYAHTDIEPSYLYKYKHTHAHTHTCMYIYILYNYLFNNYNINML